QSQGGERQLEGRGVWALQLRNIVRPWLRQLQGRLKRAYLVSKELERRVILGAVAEFDEHPDCGFAGQEALAQFRARWRFQERPQRSVLEGAGPKLFFCGLRGGIAHR